MEELKDFLGHDDPIVAKIARDINILRDGLYNDDLSKAQFDELVEDLLEADEVRRMSDRLERKIMILQAFNAIRKIVGLATR